MHRYPRSWSVLLSEIYQLRRMNTVDFYKQLCDYYQWMLWTLSLVCSFATFSNRRFKLRMPCGRDFSDSFWKGSQIGTQASTGVYFCGDCIWVMVILKGIGCNQIIVLIVLIVTHCLNEVMPFSLFNAMQILNGRKIWGRILSSFSFFSMNNRRFVLICWWTIH